jgi:hypothetical protein
MRKAGGWTTTVRGDHPDPALWVHGVVAPDRSRAVYALVQVATSVQSPGAPYVCRVLLRMPGITWPRWRPAT